MRVKDLKTTHPEYDSNLIFRHSLLYEGGDKFLQNSAAFLPKRASEGSKIYAERLKRAFYIGYVGPIIDYFISSLFTCTADINSKGPKLPFYDAFRSDVDLKGNDIDSFFKKVFTHTLIHRKSFILVDFPQLEPGTAPPINRLEEEARGLDRCYLVHFSANKLIDWQKDKIGNFEWVKLQTVDRYKPNFDSPEVTRWKWYVYTKYDYTVFEYIEDPTRSDDPDQVQATVVDSGKHSLPGQVPLYNLEVPKGLWVMNKLASVQVEIFNLDNGLAWQQYQSYYSMPVINLDENKEFKQKLGESYYIKLGLQEKFSWAEPEGKLMQAGLDRREMLQAELHRIIHQMSMSVKQTKSQTRQSGSSKQEDRYATEVILRAFGDEIRKAMQNILQMVSNARKDNIIWDVSGFSTFDMDSITEKYAQMLQLMALNIKSETFRKEVQKQAVDIQLEDKDPALQEKCKKEIDAADFQADIENPFNSLNPNKVAGGDKFAQRGQSPNNTRPVTAKQDSPKKPSE